MTDSRDYSNTGCFCNNCGRPVGSEHYVDTECGRFYCCDNRGECQHTAKLALSWPPISNLNEVPTGFSLYFVHQFPEDHPIPEYRQRWFVSLRETKPRGRSCRGTDPHYETPEAGVEGATAEARRILRNRVLRRRGSASA